MEARGLRHIYRENVESTWERWINVGALDFHLSLYNSRNNELRFIIL